jgi:hypothetical protein
MNPEGGFAPLPAVVARLTACSFLPPPEDSIGGDFAPSETSPRITPAKPALEHC